MSIKSGSAALLSRLEDGEHEFANDGIEMIRQDFAALVAASFPVRPPRGWFENPKLDRLTPLTITSSGQVFGHIAGWKSAHIGMAGGVRAPRSKTNYAYFKTGVLETDDGSMVDVGQITLTGGHAPLEASVRDAVAHYDNTQSAVMDVNCGEDRHGIWVAGALRPDVDETKLRAIRASSVSGDWRPIRGKLELVAICSVNCPGFPIPRAFVAGGAPQALVAAGTGPLIELALQHAVGADADSDDVKLLHARVDRMEQMQLAAMNTDAMVASSAPATTLESARANRQQRMALTAAVKRIASLEQTLAALAASARADNSLSEKVAVEKTSAEDREAIIASLRNRVRAVAGSDELRKQELRRRVRGATV